MNYQKASSLLLCIAMDLIGYATYSIPVLGEFADIIWAPISALIFSWCSAAGKVPWAGSLISGRNVAGNRFYSIFYADVAMAKYQANKTNSCYKSK